MFAAPGFLPSLIIWKDKRQLPHASTPPALQELAALIPLPEPFEVSCYLEQILQNAFESREGEGTTASSRDMDSAHRLRREAVWVRKGHEPRSHLLQDCEGEEGNNFWGGSHAPTPPPSFSMGHLLGNILQKAFTWRETGQAGVVFSVQYLRVVSISRVHLHFQNFSLESDKRKKKGIVFSPSSCPSTPPVL